MNSLKRIGFLVAWALIGAVIGLAFAWAQVSGLLIRWQNLGRPPENSVEIIAANARAVWIETASGKIYISSLEGGWRQAEGYVPQGERASGELPVRRRPKPLEDAVDSYTSTQSAGGEIIYSLYTIRADGSVYLWQDWPKPSDRNNLLIAPVLSTILFSWLALVIAGYRGFVKKVQERKKPGTVAEEILRLPRGTRW
ncbi:MAG TPA: hypothetical protein VE136_13915 [Anaerolineales bacterium]|jgi:hypothetical protein|nr:hypothetical protein [Anaerolineales bacterium]